jgi:hypothetical protein
VSPDRSRSAFASSVRPSLLGFEPVAKMPGEFAARIEAEIPKWGSYPRRYIKAEPLLKMAKRSLITR